MSPIVLAWVGLVTVLWVGIVAGIWALLSGSNEYPAEPSTITPEE